MKTDIYLDTTVISALFDKRTPERMRQTQQFWEHITDYNVYISELVIDELKGALQPLKGKMLEKVSGFTSLFIRNCISKMQYFQKNILQMLFIRQ